MKMISTLLILIISLALSLSGCGRRQSNTATPAPSKASPSPSDTIQTNDPVAATLDEVATLSYETRSTLSTVVDKMDRQVNALMAQWVAAGRKFPDENEAQFRNARRLLTEKLNALSMATPETWGSAKDQSMVALQNVRGALHAMETNAK